MHESLYNGIETTQTQRVPQEPARKRIGGSPIAQPPPPPALASIECQAFELECLSKPKANAAVKVCQAQSWCLHPILAKSEFQWLPSCSLAKQGPQGNALNRVWAFSRGHRICWYAHGCTRFPCMWPCTHTTRTSQTFTLTPT